MKSDSASAPLRSILGSKEFLSRIVATANALKQTTDLINNFFEEDEIDDRKVDGRF